jgi:hypothetical protein
MSSAVPRSRQAEVEPVEFLDWLDVFEILREDFKQGDHVTIIGPTGAGKTHIAIEVAELRTYVLFIACKPRDPLISELRSRGYYETRDLELAYAERRGGQAVPLHRKVVYWPRFTEKETGGDQMREQALQSAAVRRAFSYARRNGSWALVIDEGTWVCRDLKLQRVADSMWFQGRTLGVSVIMCAQRPAWVGQYALSQADHLFLFQTAHTEDLKSLGDITGVNTWTVRQTVSELDTRSHECLYVNTRTREMFRTIAPGR